MLHLLALGVGVHQRLEVVGRARPLLIARLHHTEVVRSYGRDRRIVYVGRGGAEFAGSELLRLFIRGITTVWRSPLHDSSPF